MNNNFYRVQANINLDAVRQNILNGKKLLKSGTKMMVVVKADAYGHGAVNIVKNVDDIADAYAVAIPEEGVELRKKGATKKPILVLGYTFPELCEEAIVNDISLAAFDFETVKKYDEVAAELGKKAVIHLKLDTGMSRIGYQCDTDEQIERFEKLGHEATLAASQIKTFSMLIDTLKEAIGSGWAQSWEIIVGDLEEAKELWTEVGNVLGGFIDKMSDSRNELLKGWDELGGRQYIIDGLRKAFEALLAILKPIGEAFNETFRMISKYDLGDFSKNFYDLMGKLVIFANEIAPTIKSVAKGVFGVINLGAQFLSAFGKALVPVIGFVWKLVYGILQVVGSIGEIISVIAKVTAKAKVFDQIFALILYGIDKFLKGIAPIVSLIETIIVGLLDISVKVNNTESFGITYEAY